MILRQAKQKRQAQKEREQQSEADSTTITKLNVKITNLHKVGMLCQHFPTVQHNQVCMHFPTSVHEQETCVQWNIYFSSSKYSCVHPGIWSVCVNNKFTTVL